MPVREVEDINAVTRGGLDGDVCRLRLGECQSTRGDGRGWACSEDLEADRFAVAGQQVGAHDRFDQDGAMAVD